MARIIYSHPKQTRYEYHIYTDLDFWDARRLLKDLASVRRNFGNSPSGDEFPTQVVGNGFSASVMKKIERRIKRAITSPPRHVVVRSMVYDGYFEFDPSEYYPQRWSTRQVLHFTYHRLPLQQGSLCNPYQTVKLSMADNLVRVERVQRKEKFDPIIKTAKQARAHLVVPSCF